jgi:hypothetical protein
LPGHDARRPSPPLADAEPEEEVPVGGADVLALLDSSATGLGTAAAARRARLVGPNRVKWVGSRPPVPRFLEQFWSRLALLLWIGEALALLARQPELGWAVFMVIVVNGGFSFGQEYRAEWATEALQQLLPREVIVARGCREPQLAATALVRVFHAPWRGRAMVLAAAEGAGQGDGGRDEGAEKRV